jgi:hypothetical protein
MNKNKTNAPQAAKTPRSSVAATDDIVNRIRMTAYQLFEQRGSQPGRDIDDWLAAELQTRHRTTTRFQ